MRIFTKNTRLKVFSSIYEEFNRCKNIEVHHNSVLECDRSTTMENPTNIDTDIRSSNAFAGKILGFWLSKVL